MASMTVAKTSKVSAVCAAAAAVAQSFQRRVSSTWLFLALFSVSGRLVHIPIPSNGTAQYIARASGPSIAIGSRRVYASARSRTRGISVKLSRLPEESLQVFELNLLVPGHYLLEVLKLYDSFDPLDERLADKCVSVHTEFVGNVTVPRDPSRVPVQHVQADTWVARSTRVELPTRAQFAGAHNNSERYRHFDFMTCAYSRCRPATCSACDYPPSCLIGASHPRNLRFLIPNSRHVDIRFAQANGMPCKRKRIYTKPDVFNHPPRGPSPSMKRLRAKVHACQGKLTFLHLGQWDFSGHCGLTPFHTFREDFETLVKGLKAIVADLAIITMNHMPLIRDALSCPPIDWRTPPIIDEANRIMITVGEQLGVPVLDNTDIIAPMWDQARDWFHPHGPVLGALGCRLRNVLCNWRANERHSNTSSAAAATDAADAAELHF